MKDKNNSLHKDINEFYKFEKYPPELKGHNLMQEELSKINRNLAEFLIKKGYTKET